MISSVLHIIPPVKNNSRQYSLQRFKKTRNQMSEEPNESEYSVSEYVRKLLSKVFWSTTKDMDFHAMVMAKKEN